MNLFICSDLHIDCLTPDEYEHFTFPKADAYLIAGDHMNGVVDEHYHWLLEKTNGTPTYLSPGNHDYYGSTRHAAIEKMRALTKGTHIQIVFDQGVEIASGLQLWASDFWTDLRVSGDDREVIEVSKTQWDDFGVTEIETENGYRALTPEDTQRWNREAVEQFLAFSAQTEDDIILMSHHGLFPESLVRNLVEEPLTAIDGLRTSDLRDQLLGYVNAPLLVINGHIHEYNQQPLTDRTHLFCNPRGNVGQFRQTLVALEQVDGKYQLRFNEGD
jgi:hypothetical protein